MNELVDELRAACKAAPKNDRVVTIHLFGIRHAARLKGVNLKLLAERAGISHTYGTELRKGVRLADHVTIRG
jgi:hypothetical protein